MSKNTSDDEKPSRMTRFECDCGLTAELKMEHPARVEIQCPDLRCGRIYEVEYVGRIQPLREPAPVLRLAESA